MVFLQVQKLPIKEYVSGRFSNFSGIAGEAGVGGGRSVRIEIATRLITPPLTGLVTLGNDVECPFAHL